MKKKSYFLLITLLIWGLIMFVKDDLLKSQTHFYIEFDIENIEKYYWYIVVVANLILLITFNFSEFKNILSKKFWKNSFQPTLNVLFIVNIWLFFFCKEIFISSYLYLNRQKGTPITSKSYQLTKNDKTVFDKTFSTDDNGNLELYDLIRLGLINYEKLQGH